jgi:hypothetical protein
VRLVFGFCAATIGGLGILGGLTNILSEKEEDGVGGILFGFILFGALLYFGVQSFRRAVKDLNQPPDSSS